MAPTKTEPSCSSDESNARGMLCQRGLEPPHPTLLLSDKVGSSPHPLLQLMYKTSRLKKLRKIKKVHTSSPTAKEYPRTE
jgi:hypothetical protein